jgi:hypothetical protein
MNRAKFAGSLLAMGGFTLLIGLVLLAIKFIEQLAKWAEIFVLVGLVMLVIGMLFRKRY